MTTRPPPDEWPAWAVEQVHLADPDPTWPVRAAELADEVHGMLGSHAGSCS